MKSRSFIYIALGLDLLLAAAKFIAAGFTGSASMISEGIHSTIDATSQILLIWGISTSKKKADEERPFGYGKELYFWSFIVSLITFLLGGCISMYEGFVRIKKPAFEGNPISDYIILGLAFVLNLISMRTASKAFKRQRGKTVFWDAVLKTKDPTTLIVLLGDYGDLLGIGIAFIGIFLGHVLHNPLYDGITSMIIGFILASISVLLIRESKSLLVGETPGKKQLAQALAITESDESVIRVKKHFSTVMSPDHTVLILNTVFKENLTTSQITEAIQRISGDIQKGCSDIKQIFIEPVKN
jgi:cation diffusion facilitator family transporter